jgi:NAD(P)-dependent dehydrogenase (short-subunit alcohol dehydrogenase family)
MLKKEFDLSNKVALVVGGRGLLGRRFCSVLVESGARVFSADLSHLSPAASSDHTTAVQTLPGLDQYDVDVTDPASVSELVSEVLSKASQIDILLYSVTAKPRDFYKPFTECSLEGWQLVLKAELDGLFLVTQEVGRVMERMGRGSIVFLSSIYGIVGNDQRIYEGANLPDVYTGVQDLEQKQIYSHAVYAAAKGAVISLTRYLAAYWGGQNIRVNCISPGGLAHPGENEEFVKRYSERVPLGRKARLDEINGAVLFLASDASSYITGHNLVVDGGWTAW